MMKLHFNKILFSSSLLLLLISDVLSYPVFGTKRYGRSVAPLPPLREPSYSSMPLHSNHYPLPPSYYVPSYGPNYDLDYGNIGQDPSYNSYTAMSTPLYYSSNTNDNLGYGLYPSLVPAYYDARRSGYGYYGSDDNISPVDDIHEEMQDDEREERGDALPIGQETWFENSGQKQLQTQESIADVNAAFLRNLILSQMYSDVQSLETPSAYRPEQLNEDWYYDDPSQQHANARYYSGTVDYEDEDVKELKSLAKKTIESNSEHLNRASRIQENSNWYGKAVRSPTYWSGATKKRNMDYGTIVDKPANSRWVPTSYAEGLDLKAPYDTVEEMSSEEHREDDVSTTSEVPLTHSPTTPAPDFDSRRGQKEVPLLRPATARHHSSEDTIERYLQTRAVDKTADTPPNKSVYDTIKHLLSLEQDLHKDSDEVRAQPHKRFVSNEESLVDQLGGLKKITS